MVTPRLAAFMAARDRLIQMMRNGLVIEKVPKPLETVTVFRDFVEDAVPIGKVLLHQKSAWDREFPNDSPEDLGVAWTKYALQMIKLLKATPSNTGPLTSWRSGHMFKHGLRMRSLSTAAPTHSCETSRRPLGSQGWYVFSRGTLKPRKKQIEDPSRTLP